MAAYIAKDPEINLLFAESEKMYRSLIESVKNGVYMADMQDNLFFVNQSFVDLLGYDNKGDLLGKNLARDIYMDPHQRGVFLRAMEKWGFVRDFEIVNRRKDGSEITVSVTSNFIRNAAGRAIGVEGIVHDVTAQKNLEERLRNEKRKLEELLDFDENITSIRNVDKLVDFIVGKTSRILRARRCSLMLYDDMTDELCIKAAKGLSEEIVVNTRLKTGEGIAGRVALEGRPVLVKNIEYDDRFGRKNRPGYATRSFMCAPIMIKKRMIGIMNVSDRDAGAGLQEPFHDLDLGVLNAIVRQSARQIENAHIYKELEYLSVTDPMTNLANYRFFVNTIEEEIERHKRFGQPFSLFMIDIDEFKVYNDTFGHGAGDALLKETGRLFSSNLRTIDKVCRYGGDEFVILLPGTKGPEARSVAEKLRRLIETHRFRKPVTVSIGVAEFRQALTRLEFVMRVDSCLYRAKQEGKNRVCFCSPSACRS